MSDLPFRERNNDRRVGAWLLLGLAVLFGGLYVAGYLLTGDRVPRGTSVEGVDIGGMQPAAAQQALAEGLAGAAGKVVVVGANDVRVRIDPAEAGLAVAIEESVAQTGGGRSWHPARIWEYLAGGKDYDAVLSVDEQRLESAVAAVAKKVDHPAKEGGIRFKDGRAVAQLPRTGMEIDRGATGEALTEAFLTPTDVVEVPVTEVKADVTREEVRAGMDDFANPAMSAPVILEVGARNVVVRPDTYSQALSMKAQDGKLVPALDEKKLLEAIGPDLKEASVKPEPATVRLVEGDPKVVRGKNGVSFKRKQITQQFLTLVIQRGENRTLQVKTAKKRPKFTIKDARKLKITEVVSSFTTYFPHSDYRNTNLGRAGELINGTVLRPGESFSLNDTVGERTAANGFVEGFIISDGVYKEDFGGGVSQVATTTFNAAFFAGLEDVEHHPHSFYISRYPLGREATVAWGYLDLKFKNDTPHGILIEAGIAPSSPGSQGEMTVRMWSTQYWDITASVSERYEFTDFDTRRIKDDECVPNDGYRGFEVDVYRYFRKAGSDALHHKERMHTTYKPSDTVVCEDPPDPA